MPYWNPGLGATLTPVSDAIAATMAPATPGFIDPATSILNVLEASPTGGYQYAMDGTVPASVMSSMGLNFNAGAARLTQAQTLAVIAAMGAPAGSSATTTLPTSWFTAQTIFSSVPNWAVLAGGGLALVLLARGFK
jgi:hypothetical protein